MVVEISETFFLNEVRNLGEDHRKTIENHLRENTQLINEPIFRALWAYVYALKGDYLSVVAQAEAAERLALRRQDCYLLEIIDMSQALRIASIRAHGISEQRDEVLFDGFTTVLPDSRGNRLVDRAVVVCEALAAIIYAETGRQLDVGEDCQIKSVTQLQ
ncbi:hypothetical protein [Ruegeria conchae]|uniref:Uncharacterized protein n=1 Tax=Ruegeria conchae TaxID=981384 RepID=A0A497YVB0_9RHOB|nr:hypothetical protein [Ruegeria conchae]RLK00009.1 hypothetical protein CLV75_3933 [Ruegeria conchae]